MNSISPRTILGPMRVCFSFAARPGREAEFRRLLDDPAAGRAVARGLGAVRNTLFLGRDRMVRILEFPDGVAPRPLAELARQDPAVAAFLRRLGPLVQDGFDVDVPGSLEAFNGRALLPLAYDVRAE